MTKDLLTAAEAAELAGLSPVSFRSAMYYARKLGVDCRVQTPEGVRWSKPDLENYLAARPGRGRWRKGAAERLGTERAVPRSTRYRGGDYEWENTERSPAASSATREDDR